MKSTKVGMGVVLITPTSALIYRFTKSSPRALNWHVSNGASSV